MKKYWWIVLVVILGLIGLFLLYSYSSKGVLLGPQPDYTEKCGLCGGPECGGVHFETSCGKDRSWTCQKSKLCDPNKPIKGYACNCKKSALQ